MLCILYVIAVGTLLGAAGVFVERVLPARFSRRWVWCVVIPLSVFLPGLYRSHHTWSVTDALEQQALRSPLDDALGSGSFAVLDPAWWGHLDSYDTMIHRVWLTASALLVIWALANALRVAYLIHASQQPRGRSNR